MFIKRATRGFQYGLGYLFARDFYSKSKELGPTILIIILCIAGPIAISLYFFRKINDLVYSMSQGEKKDTGEHVSIFKRILSIIILPFMIITLLYITPPLLHFVDLLLYLSLVIIFMILNASYSLIALLFSDYSFSVIFEQGVEYAWHIKSTLTGKSFSVFLFSNLGTIVYELFNYFNINLSTWNVYQAIYVPPSCASEMRFFNNTYQCGITGFITMFYYRSLITANISMLLIVCFLFEPIFNLIKYKKIIKARDKDNEDLIIVRNLERSKYSMEIDEINNHNKRFCKSINLSHYEFKVGGNYTCNGNQFRLESKDDDFLEFFPIGQRGKRAYIYKGSYGLFEYYTGIIKQGAQYSVKTAEHVEDLSKIIKNIKGNHSSIDNEIRKIKFLSSKNQTTNTDVKKNESDKEKKSSDENSEFDQTTNENIPDSDSDPQDIELHDSDPKGSDPYKYLENLKELFDEGVLSEEEYNSKRKKLLEQI